MGGEGFLEDPVALLGQLNLDPPAIAVDGLAPDQPFGDQPVEYPGEGAFGYERSGR